MNAPAPKVSFVSLGCPKALVDSERIITQLRAQGYELTKRHDGADVVIVNTCGFLDSAKAESLGAIGEAMAENGKVIVTGCMGAEPEPICTASRTSWPSPDRGNTKPSSLPSMRLRPLRKIPLWTSCRRWASSSRRATTPT